MITELISLAIVALVGWMSGGFVLGSVAAILLGLYKDISVKWGGSRSPLGAGANAIIPCVCGSVAIFVLNCSFYIAGRFALNNIDLDSILTANSVLVAIGAATGLIGLGIGICLGDSDTRRFALDIKSQLAVLLMPIWTPLLLGWLYYYYVIRVSRSRANN